jgi:hypothetical protein
MKRRSTKEKMDETSQKSGLYFATDHDNDDVIFECSFSQQTVVLSVNSINWLVFVIEKRGVYCEVETEI